MERKITLAYTPRADAWLRAAGAGALALLAFAPTSPASAQIHCTQWVDTVLDTSDNCVNEPWRERAMEVEAFTWKGHEYVILNEGNEFSIFNIDNPVDPNRVTTSNFKFGTRGDSDYDLTQFDVCDECRYGVFAHKVKRTVVFDLGTGAVPTFPDDAYGFFQVPADLSLGGYVFQKGAQQYLIAADIPGGCVGSSGLYTLDGVGNAGLIECIEIGGSPLLVRGLQTLNTAGEITYLYAAGGNGPVHVLRADGAGAALDLVHMDSPSGMFGRRYELSIDDDNMRAASANLNDGVVSTWSLADPAHPSLRHTIPAIATVVSLRSPSADNASTLFMAMIGWSRSARTFVVDDGVPDEFEPTYWSDESLAHNDLPSCGIEIGGTLSSDGSVLFISRNAVHQVFDLIECLDPVPAVADLVVTPAEVFPGDTVEIRDVSSGQIHRWALWVTEEPGGVVAAGNATPSDTNPWKITFQIPQDLPWGTSYTAHVKVESDDLVPATPDFDTGIVINRTPQAAITVEPSAVVVGESVTLTASAGGNPAPNPYSWTIDPPSSPSFNRSGASTIVTLDQIGAWDFHLTVGFDHGAEAGGLYETTASVLDFQPTSVVADFTISPQNPFHNQQITLDGSSSRPTGGDLSFAWRVESASHDYTSCPAAAVCTIPADSLNPDTTYTVTLAVTNNDDAVVSETAKPLEVADGTFQPTIEFSPSNPEIGDTVIFTIQGVPIDIDRANWSMGGPGCGAADPTPECVPGLWTDCKVEAYKYAFGGAWTVDVSVEIDGDVYQAAPTVVRIASTGDCGANGWSCGNAAYDSGISVGAASLGVGSAGDPNYVFAVKFVLDDFGYQPNRFEITAFCAANQIDSTAQGGPWPNEVFIHPDSGGLPDDSIVLGHGTIWIGDGSGPSEVVLTTPVPVDGDFWLLSRGDPRWAGEVLNMEHDGGPNVGRSYVSSTGIPGLQPAAQGNFLLRTTVEPDNDIFTNGFESGDFSAWWFVPTNIFADGFESGTVSAWSSAESSATP